MSTDISTTAHETSSQHTQCHKSSTTLHNTLLFPSKYSYITGLNGILRLDRRFRTVLGNA